MHTVAGINEKNRKQLDILNRFGKRLFSSKEAADTLGMSHARAGMMLAYLARRGWLARIKSGLYTTVPLGTTNPQACSEKPWLIANRVFAPCYIGGWSAAEHWEFTDQIFSGTYVVTRRPFRARTTRIKDSEFVLKLKRSDSRTVGVWLENTKVQVATPAQTIADLLDDPAAGGGMRHGAEIISNYFASEHRDDKLLLECMAAGGNRTAYKRLGYVLERLHIDAANCSDECRRQISAGYSPFDPTVKKKGKYNRRWMLRVNAEIAG